MVIWRMIYRLFICAAEADYSVVFIILEQPNVTNLISIINYHTIWLNLKDNPSNGCQTQIPKIKEKCFTTVALIAILLLSGPGWRSPFEKYALGSRKCTSLFNFFVFIRVKLLSKPSLGYFPSSAFVTPNNQLNNLPFASPPPPPPATLAGRDLPNRIAPSSLTPNELVLS